MRNTCLIFAIVFLSVLVASHSAVQSATITVTTTEDVVDAAEGDCGSVTIADLPGPDGETSLREAICAANNNEGTDRIEFNISGAGPHTIQPNSALLEITDPVVIDGYSQDSASPATETNPATLMIELNGSHLGYGSGLTITAGSCTIKGLVINSFRYGIRIEGEGGNIIEGNYIGTNVDGTAALGNQEDGVYIKGSPNNIIGGATPVARNVISGNYHYGLILYGSGSTGNKVEGNYIGTDKNGATALPNQCGVKIIAGSSYNTIGGMTSEARNVISGNAHGVEIENISVGSDATGNKVQGNYIGTDKNGTTALPDQYWGVVITGAPGNTIGGTDVGARNVISGHSSTGVVIWQNATGNTVQGNYIGTDKSGTAALPNHESGVSIGSSTGNTIGGTDTGARNIISGNGEYGILFGGSDATGNKVEGNYIGTDKDGTTTLPNGKCGVYIVSGRNNTIGGMDAGARNVISGNGEDGVYIDHPIATGNKVEGNYIGTDKDGTTTLPNQRDGVRINYAPENAVGGATAEVRNIISGNGSTGVRIIGRYATGNKVQDNYIGTDVNGENDLGNGQSGIAIVDGASDNLVTGTFECKIKIGYNGMNGIYIEGEGTTGNIIQNCHIFYNTEAGVRVVDAGDTDSWNKISGNEIKNNPIGIHTTNSCKTVIWRNDIAGWEVEDDDGIIEEGCGNGMSRFSVLTSSATFEHIVGNTITGFDNGILFRPLTGLKGVADVAKVEPIVVLHNNIYDNLSYGILNEDPTLTIDASENWWGHESGPYHPATNPDGQGDPVSDDVDFGDWLTSFSAVSVTAGADTTGIAGTNIVVHFTISNFGAEADVFDVTVTDSLGWSISPSAFALPLEGNSDTAVSIDVFVPVALEDTVNVITVTATSQSDPSIWDSDRLALTVVAGILGDVTNDKIINVLDVLRVVNIILGVGDPPSEYELWAGDYNEDGGINVLDALGIVNVILGVIPECHGGGAMVDILPETMKFLQSLKYYLPAEDFSRFMALVKEVQLPEEFNLSQNYPNPFNPTTQISLQLPVVSGQSAQHATLKIYNILGQEVKVLVDGQVEPGYHTVQWDASDCASGIYFYRLQAGDFTATKKMVLMK